MSETSRLPDSDVSSDVAEDRVRVIPLPVHPLPEEIRKMRRDETVCRYCGVSYLIHNEIKALENKLTILQKELKNYRDIESREKKLQEDFETCKAANQELQTRFDSVTSLVGEKEREINSWICHQKELERQLHTTTKSLNSYKSKRNRILQKIENLAKEMEGHRELLTVLRADAQTVRSTFMDESQQLFVHLHDMCSQPLNENIALKSTIEHLQEENAALQTCIKKLESNLNEKEETIADLKRTEIKLKELEADRIHLQAEITVASRNHTSVVRKNHELESQNIDAKEQIRKLNVELELSQSQLRHQQETYEQTLTSLKKDISNKEGLVSLAEKEVQALKNKYSQHQKNEGELSRKVSISAEMIEELQKSLERAKCDIEALNKEREVMIIAHQNQMQQLRNSFKQKLADADLWPQKMADAIKDEKEREEKELDLLEKNLRENFVMEMQTEKKKHQQTMDDCIAAAKATENKLRNQLNMACSQNKAELMKIEAQMADCKSQFRQKEAGHQQEAESFKKIIQDLELRLARVDNGSDEKVKQLQTQLLSIQNQLSQVELERNKMESQLSSAREEISFLYDTVRRECEERNELTEALSQAREALLVHRRLGRGSSAQQNSSGNRANNLLRNSRSSTSIHSSLGHNALTSGPLTSGSTTSKTLNPGPSGDVHRGNTLLQPLLVSETEFMSSETRPSRTCDIVSPNKMLLDCEGGRTLASGRLKGSSVMDNKRHLLPIQGKK